MPMRSAVWSCNTVTAVRSVVSKGYHGSGFTLVEVNTSRSLLPISRYGARFSRYTVPAPVALGDVVLSSIPASSRISPYVSSSADPSLAGLSVVVRPLGKFTTSSSGAARIPNVVSTVT